MMAGGQNCQNRPEAPWESVDFLRKFPKIRFCGKVVEKWSKSGQNPGFFGFVVSKMSKVVPKPLLSVRGCGENVRKTSKNRENAIFRVFRVLIGPGQVRWQRAWVGEGPGRLEAGQDGFCGS